MLLLPGSLRSGLGLTRTITPAPATSCPSSLRAGWPRNSTQYWSCAVVTTNACGAADARSIAPRSYVPVFATRVTRVIQPSSNFACALKSPEPVPIVSYGSPYSRAPQP